MVDLGLGFVCVCVCHADASQLPLSLHLVYNRANVNSDRAWARNTRSPSNRRMSVELSLVPASTANCVLHCNLAKL